VRFETSGEVGLMANCTVIVDKATGVNYLFAECGVSGRLTVLLDS